MKYEQIKKIIESCHLNFLIGSGASKPSKMPKFEMQNSLEL